VVALLQAYVRAGEAAPEGAALQLAAAASEQLTLAALYMHGHDAAAGLVALGQCRPGAEQVKVIGQAAAALADRVAAKCVGKLQLDQVRGVQHALEALGLQQHALYAVLPGATAQVSA